MHTNTGTCYPTWWTGFSSEMVILLYHAACALTTVLATPRGEQSSHRKWYLFCITTPHAHQLRILLPHVEQASHRKWYFSVLPHRMRTNTGTCKLQPHVVNRLLIGNGNFSVLPRRMRQIPDLATHVGNRHLIEIVNFAVWPRLGTYAGSCYPTWLIGISPKKLILLYYRACALTPDHAIPRGEQASHRKW